MAFVPDGKTALYGSNDKTLSLWDVATGKCLVVFETDYPILSADWKGSEFVFGNNGGFVVGGEVIVSP